MAKIVFVYLTIFFVAITSAHVVHEHPTTYVEASHDYSPVEEVEVTVEDSDYTELYSTFANNIFDFVAKLVRSKVDLLLWLERTAIGIIIQLAFQLKHLVTNHGGTVTGVVNTVVEVMKVFMQNDNEYVVENDIPHY